jgi:hypothetical protein
MMFFRSFDVHFDLKIIELVMRRMKINEYFGKNGYLMVSDSC